MSSLASELEV